MTGLIKEKIFKILKMKFYKKHNKTIQLHINDNYFYTLDSCYIKDNTICLNKDL